MVKEYISFYKSSPMRGISLITLVITIIVVIILAGAVILSLSQNNPIETANKATFLQDVTTYRDELSMYIISEYGRLKGNFDPKTINCSGEDAKADGIIPSMREPEHTDIFAIKEGQLVLLERASEKQKSWFDGEIINGDISDPEEPMVPQIDVGVIASDNSTINGEVGSYDNPIIPKGFKAINTTDASWNLSEGFPMGWNNGLAIEDISGNQFVWVPVDGSIVKYEKDFTYPSSYDADANNTIDDTTIDEGVIINYEEIATSINTYKGFYISRYEASFDYNGNDLRAVSKKSTNASISLWARDESQTGKLWNFINYTDAKIYAGKMAEGYSHDTLKLKTNLITGAQWDTVMKWISESGINVIDSIGWGNYYNATFTYEWPSLGTKEINMDILLNTGAAERNKAKNIYDLAGNIWEWTSEIYSTNRVLRGGSYSPDSSNGLAAYRNSRDVTTESVFRGFRSALYIL